MYVCVNFQLPILSPTHALTSQDNTTRNVGGDEEEEREREYRYYCLSSAKQEFENRYAVEIKRAKQTGKK